jgi:phage I-like protein
LNRKRRITLAFGPRIPPTEFLIFPYGKISTLKGDFQLTERSAQMLMRLYEEHGVDIMFDYEHLGLKPEATSNGKAPAAAWAKLALRADGIWLTHIKWTQAGADHLRSGEYRYLSPAFNINPKTGEIVELINVALTNLPATNNIKPLVEASRLASRRNSGSDRPTALARSKTMKAHPLAKHLKEHMAKHELSSKTMAEKCSMTHERMKKLTAGHPPTQEEMKKCGKFLGLGHEKMKKLSEHKADEEAAHHEADEEAAREADEEHSVNGLDPDKEKGPHDDDEDDTMTSSAADEVNIPHSGDEADENREDNIPTSRVSLSGADDEEEDDVDPVTLSRETLAALTGENDPKKQKAALVELTRKAKAFDQDHDTVVALTRDNEDRARRELVALGRKEKKLTPDSEKFWLKQPVATFREWLKSAPPIAALQGGELEQLTPEGVTGVTLTREEAQVNEILGDDPREFANFKKDMAGAEPFKLSRKVQTRLMQSFLGRPTDLDAARE